MADSNLGDEIRAVLSDTQNLPPQLLDYLIQHATLNPQQVGVGKAPAFQATGLTGSTAASRYVGATTSGAPASGYHLVGDYVIDQSGSVWICTAAGSPGTWAKISSTSSTRVLEVTIDGAGSALTAGIVGDVFFDFAATITKATLLADQTGSIVIDIWKAAYGSFPPTVANTITASAKPTLSSATKAQDSTLTGWTTAISAGDVLRFHIDSASTVTRVLLALTLSS